MNNLLLRSHVRMITTNALLIFLMALAFTGANLMAHGQQTPCVWAW